MKTLCYALSYQDKEFHTLDVVYVTTINCAQYERT
jgi:hypothetical protein